MNGIEWARRYLANRQPDRALDALDDAGPDAVTHPDFWALRASALLELNRHDDALTTALRGLKSNPENVELHYVRAHALQDAEQWIDSESAFETVLALDQHHVHALADYSINLAARLHFERARILIDRLATAHPEAIERDIAEAFWNESMGKRREAREWVAQALQKEPENPQAQMLAGRLAMRVGDVSQTAELRQSVTAQSPGGREKERSTNAAEAFESGSARWLAPGLRINPWLLLIVGLFILFVAVPMMQSGSGLGALLFYGWLGTWIYSLVARGVYWWLNT